MPATAVAADHVINRVMLRLIPPIVILYIFNYLDRVNVSFAKLTMNADLGFSEAVYGFGAGVFYVSYCLFEVHSNLIMQRVGPRIWLARIMITWGIISSAMMFVRGAPSFYLLRFLLGAAEAGFAPGILLYLTYWFPVREQARAVAWFLTATAMSGLVGAPLAGLLLGLDGRPLLGHPLHGWQWLFLLEGIPSVLGGFAILALLPDNPARARWLSADERAVLTGALASEEAQRHAHRHSAIRDAFGSGRVWLLTLIYCGIMFGFQGINFWLPTIIKQATGLTDNRSVGLVSAIPFFVAMVAMVIVGRHSDRTGERRVHVAICAALGAASLLACTRAHSPILVLLALCAAAGAIWSTLGPFWAIPPAFLTGTAAATGLALINSFGNLVNGFMGPWVTGVLKDRYHDDRPGLLAASLALLIAAALATRVRGSGVTTFTESP